jgi:arylsulfatase A-like enzyme
VVFLSIDAVRADHVGAYGYARATTPQLDAFATRAARFERAYTTAPQTTRAFASVFTGRPPHALCWGRDPQFPPLRDPNEMLAEVLRSEGYATAAFTNTSYFALTAGFNQGFDVFEQGGGFKDDAELSAARANEWVERMARTPRPFFLWLHLVDPHEPYTDRTTPKDFGHDAVDRYDEEIANADRALARVVPTLDAIERAGRPLFVFVFSDHGEAFGEHGVFFHSFDAHEEALRVPLMVRGPGVVPGPRRQLTSLMDLFPTVLSLVGRTPSMRSPARPLTYVLSHPDATPWRTALFADVAPNGDQRVSAMALVAPPWKLLHDVTRGAWELVHLERDPGERENVIDREAAVAERLRARLSDMARPMTGHCPRR